MAIEDTLTQFATTGGLSLGVGYAAGRVTRMAVDVVKWILGMITALFIGLDYLGVITIHFDRAVEVSQNLFGVASIQEFMTVFTEFLLTAIPSTLGLGGGFYAGYKKIIV